MSKHTPGPWQVAAYLNDGRIGIYDGDGYRVASVHDFNYREENKANAALIAAAPDMYRALEVIASTLDALDEMDNLRSIARAAIRKATGGES